MHSFQLAWSTGVVKLYLPEAVEHVDYGEQLNMFAQRL